MEQQIGFIGLGIMGVPMARNLLKAGYSLTVYNRTGGKAKELAGEGAGTAAVPHDVGRKAGTVVLMLTGPEAIEAVLWGEKGLLGEGTQCRTLVNMSTVSPAYTRDLAGRLGKEGVGLVDAPVSGSRKPAEEGNLVILAGGDPATVKELEPLFLTVGKKVVHCGEAGAGSNMKMFINLLLCTMVSGLSESLTLGEQCGLTREAMLETVLAGPLGCGLFTMKEGMMRTGDFPVQFPFKHMFKDLNFILETAREKGMQARIGQTLRDIYANGMEQGFGDLDFAAVKKVMEG